MFLTICQRITLILFFLQDRFNLIKNKYEVVAMAARIEKNIGCYAESIGTKIKRQQGLVL